MGLEEGARSGSDHSPDAVTNPAPAFTRPRQRAEPVAGQVENLLPLKQRIFQSAVEDTG